MNTSPAAAAPRVRPVTDLCYRSLVAFLSRADQLPHSSLLRNQLICHLADVPQKYRIGRQRRRRGDAASEQQGQTQEHVQERQQDPATPKPALGWREYFAASPKCVFVAVGDVSPELLTEEARLTDDASRSADGEAAAHRHADHADHAERERIWALVRVATHARVLPPPPPPRGSGDTAGTTAAAGQAPSANRSPSVQLWLSTEKELNEAHGVGAHLSRIDVAHAAGAAAAAAAAEEAEGEEDDDARADGAQPWRWPLPRAGAARPLAALRPYAPPAAAATPQARARRRALAQRTLALLEHVVLTHVPAALRAHFPERAVLQDVLEQGSGRREHPVLYHGVNALVSQFILARVGAKRPPDHGPSPPPRAPADEALQTTGGAAPTPAPGHVPALGRDPQAPPCDAAPYKVGYHGYCAQFVRSVSAEDYALFEQALAGGTQGSGSSSTADSDDSQRLLGRLDGWTVDAIQEEDIPLFRAHMSIPYPEGYVRFVARLSVLMRRRRAESRADGANGSAMDGADGTVGGWVGVHEDLRLASLHVLEPFRRGGARCGGQPLSGAITRLAAVLVAEAQKAALRALGIDCAGPPPPGAPHKDPLAVVAVTEFHNGPGLAFFERAGFQLSCAPAVWVNVVYPEHEPDSSMNGRA